MKRNESNTDRVIRVVGGLMLAYFAMVGAGPYTTFFWILAALLIVTGAVGFCPIYRLLNHSTKPRGAAS